VFQFSVDSLGNEFLLIA
jgi:hypothetical protein